MKTIKSLCTFTAAFFIVAGLMGGVSVVYAAYGNAGVIPPRAEPFSNTYGEWSAKWWQWNYSLPINSHPLFDSADCSAGQSGKVWFLGGTFAAIEEEPGVVRGEADRECHIPQGTALFFPILNVECNAILDGSADEDFLRECANSVADHIQELQVTIDGNEVEHIGLYRAESPLFTIGPLPDDNIIGADAGSSFDAVGDGFFIMLAPLPVGEHDIHFEGAAVFTIVEDGFDLRFEQDITYHIEVNGFRR